MMNQKKFVAENRKSFVTFFNEWSKANNESLISTENLDKPELLGEETVCLHYSEINESFPESMCFVVHNIYSEDEMFDVNSICIDEERTLSMIYYDNILLECVIQIISPNSDGISRKQIHFQPEKMTREEIIEKFYHINSNTTQYISKYNDIVDKNEIDLLNLIYKNNGEDNSPKKDSFNDNEDFGDVYDWI